MRSIRLVATKDGALSARGGSTIVRESAALSSWSVAVAAALLFASGAAALVYQVLWIKQLSLVVGVDVYAVTTGISAFFAGLAAGGLVLGRMADRAERPLLLYAAIEGGVAILAIVTT